MMRIRTIPWAILRMQYRLARVPVRLVEEQVLHRLGPEAPARLLYDRIVGGLDATVGMLLSDNALEGEGLARIERADELEQAAHLDEIAARQLRRADAELRRRHDETQAAPRRARKAAKREIDHARSEARARSEDAVHTALARTEATKRRLDEQAEQRVEAAEAQHRQSERRISAAEKSVTDVSDAQLDDAADKRSAAAGARAHADRLQEFSDDEKKARQAARTAQS